MKFARVAVPLVAVLMFAGCGTPSGATAFQVGDQKVSEKLVDQTAEACATIMQKEPREIRTQVAQLLLLGELAPAIAKVGGIELTPAMETKTLAQLNTGAVMSDPACAKSATALAKFGAVSEKLGQEKTIAAMKKLDVKVNPAYGTFDPSTAQFSLTTGSLSSEDLGLGKVFGN